jgi:hypothetical protein
MTGSAVVMRMVMAAFLHENMTGHFLRGGVVYGFDPDINSSTFGLVWRIIPKTQAGNTS